MIDGCITKVDRFVKTVIILFTDRIGPIKIILIRNNGGIITTAARSQYIRSRFTECHSSRLSTPKTQGSITRVNQRLKTFLSIIITTFGSNRATIVFFQKSEQPEQTIRVAANAYNNVIRFIIFILYQLKFYIQTKYKLFCHRERNTSSLFGIIIINLAESKEILCCSIYTESG